MPLRRSSWVDLVLLGAVCRWRFLAASACSDCARSRSFGFPAPCGRGVRIDAISIVATVDECPARCPVRLRFVARVPLLLLWCVFLSLKCGCWLPFAPVSGVGRIVDEGRRRRPRPCRDPGRRQLSLYAWSVLFCGRSLRLRCSAGRLFGSRLAEAHCSRRVTAALPLAGALDGRAPCVIGARRVGLCSSRPSRRSVVPGPGRSGRCAGSRRCAAGRRLPCSASRWRAARRLADPGVGGRALVARIDCRESWRCRSKHRVRAAFCWRPKERSRGR